MDDSDSEDGSGDEERGNSQASVTVEEKRGHRICSVKGTGGGREAKRA